VDDVGRACEEALVVAGPRRAEEQVADAVAVEVAVGERRAGAFNAQRAVDPQAAGGLRRGDVAGSLTRWP
jgi:hypothetical protein